MSHFTYRSWFDIPEPVSFISTVSL